MNYLVILLVIPIVTQTEGVFDDAHVEQYHDSPFVQSTDPGTHLSNRNTRSQEFQSIGSNPGPYSSSSRQEFHEEQRYVNGEPVFEKKHERRFQDGQLVFEDGYEYGDRDRAAAEHGARHGGSGSGYAGIEGGSGYVGSAGGSGYAERAGGSSFGGSNEGSYRESSQSSYSSSSSQGQVSPQAEQSESYSGFNDQFRSDIERMRQRLHAGSSLPQHGSSYQEERNQESHFVDGQQVYHKNQERRYEDGRLVKNEFDERGNRNAIGTTGSNPQNSHSSSSQSSSSSSTYSNSAGSQQHSPSNTAYRASYWRPGSRRTSTSSRRISQSSSGVEQAGSTPVGPGESRTPYQSSYQTSTNRQRSRLYNSRPAYRASYTPSSSIERVPQSSSSAQSSSNQRQQSSSSSSYQLRGSQAPQRPSTYGADSSAQIGGVQESNVISSETSRTSTYNQQSGYQPAVVYRPSSQSSSVASERRNYATSYGSGSYVRPTESPNSGTTRTTTRITDTHSEPYSVRSSSYQPDRFSSYSAWSHWNEESSQPSQVHQSRTSTSQSQYHSRAEDQDRSRAYQSNARDNSYTGNSYDSQQQEIRPTLSPGFLYDGYESSDPSGINEALRSSSYASRESSSYPSSESSSYPSRESSSYSPRESSSYPSRESSSYPSRESSSSHYSSSSSISSSSSSTGGGDSARVSVGARPNQSLGLALTVDVGEGDSVRVSPTGVQSVDTEEERYDINPLVDGESTASQSSGTSSSNVVSIGSSGSESGQSEYGQGGQVSSSSYRESSRSESTYSGNNREGGQRYIAPVYSSGSSYGTTRVTNQTTNTLTSHIQPLISSYKLETRTSRRYLNGQLVSETKYNRYYENGQLVHENQTVRSRDEMETDGVDVLSLDLTTQDLERYGLAQSVTVPMSHSQRYEMTQEKEFVDGNQIYESTHEKRFQDGKLIHEDHDELDQKDLESMGSQESASRFSSSRFSTSSGSSSQYRPQVESGSSYQGHSQSSYSAGTSASSGSRQISGVGEGISISVSPRTTTRKTEIRREQEFKDGQQVYDLRHEKQFEGGNLVHEDLVERGPDEFETDQHRDALRDLLSGRSLNTASQSNYESSYTGGSGGGQYAGGSYNTDSSVNSENAGGSSYGSSSSYESSSGYSSSSQDRSSSSQGEGSQNRIGSSLLTSGSLTSVIGGGSVEDFNSLNQINTQQSSTSDSDTSYGGGYYATIGGTGSGYGGATYSSRSEEERRSEVSGGRYEGAYGGYSSEGGPGQSHRREMEVEEHYQDGKLVRGRQQESEWKNEQLLKHDVKHYGEGDERNQFSSSGQVPSQSSYGSQSSSSSYSASGAYEGHGAGYGANSGAAQGSATSSFGAHSELNAGSSGSHSSSSSYEASSSYGSSSGGGGYGAGAHGGYGESHRQEMEVEEHYENGQLVRGREENEEWRNNELVKHDRREYGPGSSGSSGSSSMFTNSVSGSCSSSPCANGASCINGARGYICICSFGFRGLRCDEAYCPTRYCRHDGICEVDGSGIHSCSCPEKFTGPRCERRVRDRGTY